LSFVKDFESSLEPRDQIEWLFGEEVYFDMLEDCTVCGESEGLVWCPVCHGRKR